MSDERPPEDPEPDAPGSSEPASSEPPADSAPSYWLAPNAGAVATGARPRPGRRRAILVGAVIAFVVVVFVYVGFVVNALMTTTIADNLAVGDCFDVPTAAEVVAVDRRECTEPHTAEVFYVAEYPGDEYPTIDAFETFFADRCLSAFDAYTGRSWIEATEILIVYFHPTREGWDVGDRTITCYASHLDATPMTGSIRR